MEGALVSDAAGPMMRTVATRVSTPKRYPIRRKQNESDI